MLQQKLRNAFVDGILKLGKLGQMWTTNSVSGKEVRVNTDALPVFGQPTRLSSFEVFDDFLTATADVTNNWITFEGGTAAAQLLVAVAGVPEGQAKMVCGDANDANDKAVFSGILLSKGSLVSLGTTVVECRLAFSALTGHTFGFGLGDTLANATEVANYTVDSGTVADDASVTDGVCFVFSTDATATTKWQMVSTNAGTVGNGAAEEAVSVGPTTNIYQVLRIEVNSVGHAKFFIDGKQVGERRLAVATTALLIPYCWTDSAVDAQTSITTSFDYVLFQGARPASNA